jgi:hypothetical protein
VARGCAELLRAGDFWLHGVARGVEAGGWLPGALLFSDMPEMDVKCCTALSGSSPGVTRRDLVLLK